MWERQDKSEDEYDDHREDHDEIRDGDLHYADVKVCDGKIGQH
jgi:hypothetical protein